MIKTAIAFALGCILILQMPALPTLNWVWLLPLNVVLFIIKPTRYVAITMAAVLWTAWQCQGLLNNQLQPALYNKAITIMGTIDSIPRDQGRILRFDFTPQGNGNTRLPEKIRLSWYRPYPKNLVAGQQWQLTVKLKPPFGMMNPGSFDYEGVLFQHRIGATGYIKQAKDNIKLTQAEPWHLNAFRQQLADKISLPLAGSDNLGLVQGLLVGLRHNISHQQWQVLTRSGTNHLLAISGLHIGLTAAIGFYFFSFLWSLRARNLLFIPAKQVGAVGAILSAITYAAMAGFSIPTQRAAIMVTVFMVALLIRKTMPKSQLLAIAALIVLVIDPIAVISAGFWLSFFAVVIILLISEQRFPKPKWQWLKIHTLIAFGLSPLLLLFFSQTSLIAPFANIFAVPLVSLLIVPLILVSTLLLWAWPAASDIGFKLIDILFDLLFKALSYLSSLPYSNWEMLFSSQLIIMSIAVATLLILLPKGLPAKWLAFLAFLPLAFSSPTSTLNEGDIKFTLLDVGQGLSAIIQTQSHTLVYDSGAKFSDHFDAGKAVIIPFLKHNAIHHLDALIISHSDNDHIGGAKSILSAMPTASILTSQVNTLTDAKACLSGQSWQWDGVHFEVLSPDLHQIGSDNNLSCVVRISNDSQSILLTGDIEKSTEAKLVKRYGKNLASTILVAPHHGSNTSSSAAFIDSVAPDIVLFPAGYLNRYQFPKEKVVKRYLARGVQTYSTAKSGAISLYLNANTPLEISSWRQQQTKIWTTRLTD